MAKLPLYPGETRKQQKKRLKREGKLMLQLDQAQKTLYKAELKAARAHQQLEMQREAIQKLVEELLKVQSSPFSIPDFDEEDESKETDGTTAAYEVSPPSTRADADANSPPRDQVLSLPPTEGRTDVGSELAAPSTQAEVNDDIAQEQVTSPPPVEGRTDIGQKTTDEATGSEAVVSPVEVGNEASHVEDSGGENATSDADSDAQQAQEGGHSRRPTRRRRGSTQGEEGS